MGLDMYLEKQYLEKQEVGTPFTVEEAGYWRKANQIHKWFVDNVQNGFDDCGRYYVSHEQLKKLRNLCLEVLETGDSSRLPPMSGFFFGSTQVDEFYFENIKNTIDILENIDENCSYYYQSSW